MTLTLSENIRAFRKQRKLTQEKLAEALGVTVGAVYKWESGLSVPELNLIVEMADFFDTSVDALLGYRMKDNRPDSTLERLSRYCRTLDPAALPEAEKALGKYPHSFRIVHGCAQVYLAYGASNHDPEQLRRALELLEQAKLLLPQNDDPRVSEATIVGDMAVVWFLLDEREKSLELIKRHNAGGLFNSQIGSLLAVFSNRAEEASPYLSHALLDALSSLITTIVGYAFLFRARKDWDSAAAVIAWGLELLNGLKAEARPDSLDKTHAELLALLAYVQARAGMAEASLASLREAEEYALRFDSKPDYSLRTLRFADHADQIAVYDIFGASASESVAGMIELLDDRALAGQWKELVGHA